MLNAAMRVICYNRLYFGIKFYITDYNLSVISDQNIALSIITINYYYQQHYILIRYDR